jgi:exonuclease SbcC
LVSLLDLRRYELAGGKAREQARQLSVRLEERQSLIDSEYGDANVERLREAQQAEKDAEAGHERVRGIERQAQEKAAQIKAARATVVGATDAEGKFLVLEQSLDELVAELPSLVEESEARTAAVTSAESAVGAAEKALERAQLSLQKTIEKGGDEATIATLQAAAGQRSDELRRITEINAELESACAETKLAAEQNEAATQVATAAGATLTKSKKRAEASAAAYALATSVLACARATAAEADTRTRLDVETLARDDAMSAAELAAEHAHHLENANLAVALRVGLGSGDPCPVCEATIVTLPKTTGNIESLLKNAKRAAKSANAERLKCEQTFASAHATHGNDVARLKAALGALPSGAKVPSVDTAEIAVSEANAIAASDQSDLEAAQAAIVEAAKAAAQADASHRETAARQRGLERELDATKRRLEKTESDLRNAFPSKLPADLAATLADRAARLTEDRDRVASAEELVKTATREQSAALSKRREHEGLLAGFTKRLTETRIRTEEAVQSLERLVQLALPAPPSGSEETSDQLTTLRRCCSACAEAATALSAEATLTASTLLNDLRRIVEPLELPVDDEPDDLVNLIAAVREDRHGQLVGAGSRVAHIKEQIAKRAGLEKAIKEDAVLCARYRTLGQELQQDHFIAYILAESMERLAALATVELLQISGGRYSLLADEDGFDVIDHHNANERRTVATLSGGETFFASLALALALAGSVRDLAGTAAAARLDAIFIDEGFGALDPETLELVVDALEALSEGERMVGVISHVAELADRILSGLRVEKVGNSSRILVR